MGVIKSFSRIRKSLIEAAVGTWSAESTKFLFKSLEETIDLDKSWEIIHYLITDDKAFFSDHKFSILLSPRNHTVNLTDEEHDFYWDEAGNNEPEILKKWKEIEIKIEQQINYLNREDISDLIEIMESLDINELLSETDFAELNEEEIYPETWSDTKEDKDYVKRYYLQLLIFLKKANKNGEYVIVH